jgi:hypothetical protein
LNRRSLDGIESDTVDGEEETPSSARIADSTLETNQMGIEYVLSDFSMTAMTSSSEKPSWAGPVYGRRDGLGQMGDVS